MTTRTEGPAKRRSLNRWSKFRRHLVNTLLAIACLALPVGAWIYCNYRIPVWFPSEAARSTYGDQFGALNTLFAGLGAGGVVFALLISYQQLRIQHEEFERATESLQENQLELAAQTRLLSEQMANAIPRTHRVVSATDRLDFADLLLQKVEGSLDDAIWLIQDQVKRKEAGEAAYQMKMAWSAYMEAQISLHIALSPLPDGSTSTLASVTAIQAAITEEHARRLAEFVEWVQSNYERA